MSPVVFGVLVCLVLGFALLSRPRRFYFIRHGETLLNARRIRQGKEGALSDKGREQAAQVAKELKHHHIEAIISSDYPRALETSEIIKKELHIPIFPSELFGERRNPSDIIGRSTKDPEVERIVDQMDLTYHEDDFRHSDEENFNDIKKRARKCLALLARQGAPQTMVVTHHHFLKMLLAYMLYGEDIHAGDFIKLSFFNVSDNAGVTICEFYPLHFFSETKGWKVVSFNEQFASIAG